MNYAERQAAKKERLENAADKAKTDAQTVYTRTKSKASIIPFG